MQQFIERNPIYLGIVALSVIVLAGVLSMTLQRSDFSGGYTLTAEFKDASGVRVGDVVTVAGARAGRVAGLEIDGDHVDVELSVDGAELPVDTRAIISPRTLVGKRAVILETGDDFSKLIKPNGKIPLSQTTVFVDVPEFGKASDDLLSEVDAQALNTFLVALTDLTKGQRDEVAELIEGGTRLTSVINENEQPLRELLQRLRRLSTTLNSRDKEIVGLIDDLEIVLTRVNNRREDISALFRETRRTSKIGADLLVEIKPELDAILTEVHKDAELLARHQMDLAEALAYAPDSIGGFASISFSGDVPVPYGHVLVQGAGPAGVDVLAGCGGLLDKQLDKLLGKDPRSCAEQENDSFPGDTPPPDTDPIPDLPIDPIDLGDLDGDSAAKKQSSKPAPDAPAPTGTHRVQVGDYARALAGGGSR